MKYTKIVDEDINDIIDYCSLELLKKFENTSVLVTGATGMIGSYFVFTFLKLNEKYNYNIDINILVRNREKATEMFNDTNLNIIVQDVTNKIDLDINVDYVIHAASPASPKIMKDKPVETNFANTIGTANTLLFANEKKAKGYLFVSSREIYGEPTDNDIFTEYGILGQVDPLVPRNGYAEGKKAAENMCACFKEEYGLNTKIVRLAHTYGPGMSIHDGRVQADFLNNVIHGEDIILKSDGSSIRTYTYISDAIKAMIIVLLKSNDIVYNVASSKCKTSIKQLAQTLISLYSKKELKLVFDIKESKGAASFKTGILSTKKIEEELNFKPKYGIKDGFARTIEHLIDEENI